MLNTMQLLALSKLPAVVPLQTDQHLGPFLDLYQIHSATLESGVLGAADVLEALAHLKAEKGWAIGLSVSGELPQLHCVTHCTSCSYLLPSTCHRPAPWHTCMMYTSMLSIT
jgi:hypothetical protein